MNTKISVNDLVLQVFPDEGARLRSEEYDAFLDILFDEEYYFLSEAAYKIMHFMFSDKYKSILDVGSEFYENTKQLHEKYPTKLNYLNTFQLPDLKSCSVDLATGTGKSYLIYAIAQIALHSKLVDRVVVLCPSVTIANALTDKFNLFAGNLELQKALPESNSITPRITDSTMTILEGDICVENIHAVYANTNGSIKNSLTGKGGRTLILNDEAHHIFNKFTGADKENIKEWKKFIVNKEFNFNYVVNFTGTPYIENEYFSDIIYRYSIKTAIEDHVVKTPNWLEETESEKAMSGYDEIFQNHKLNQKNYPEIKPISIIVTSDINTCYEVYNELVVYLIKKENIGADVAKSKCIWVVSGKPEGASESERISNIQKLTSVDEDSNPVQWIISVAMLTEGWDVKNVFQIVPHESRAFNSKLLIAQVLGRGLRVPKVYKDRTDLKVIIYNHKKFSPEIRNIFNDILELDDRLPVVVDKLDKEFNFEIENFSYKKVEEIQQTRKPSVRFSENIDLQPQFKTYSNEATYLDASDQSRRTIEYLNDNTFYSMDVAIEKIYARLKSMDLEKDKNFCDTYSPNRIEDIIRKNLISKLDDFLSQDNFYRVNGSFIKLYDMGGDTIIFKNKSTQLTQISTSNLGLTYTNGSLLRKGSRGCLYFRDSYNKTLNSYEEKILLEMQNDDDHEIYKQHFKSPMLSVSTEFKPERIFIKRLISNDSFYESFIKSPDRGFYEIPYSYKKGTHMKYPIFNPDFFIKTPNQIIVVEIKSDDEDSNVSRAKLRAASEHFNDINLRLKMEKYLFFILSPHDYDYFFEALKASNIKQYKSDLMIKLS